MKIIPNDIRTIYVSFVAWLLENTNSLTITVTKKPKNFLSNIVNNLSEMNGDMVVSVADFLDNAGDDDLEMDENDGLTSKHMKSLENLYGKFEGYCKELTVSGFNSAGYDIKFLFKELCEHGQQPTFTVKKAGK